MRAHISVFLCLILIPSLIRCEDRDERIILQGLNHSDTSLKLTTLKLLRENCSDVSAYIPTVLNLCTHPNYEVRSYSMSMILSEAHLDKSAWKLIEGFLESEYLDVKILACHILLKHGVLSKKSAQIVFACERSNDPLLSFLSASFQYQTKQPDGLGNILRFLETYPEKVLGLLSRHDESSQPAIDRVTQYIEAQNCPELILKLAKNLLTQMEQKKKSESAK